MLNFTVKTITSFISILWQGKKIFIEHLQVLYNKGIIIFLNIFPDARCAMNIDENGTDQNGLKQNTIQLMQIKRKLVYQNL